MGCGSSTNTLTVVSRPASQDATISDVTLNSNDKQQSFHIGADVYPSLQPDTRDVTVVQNQALPSQDKHESKDTLKNNPLTSPFNVKWSLECSENDAQQQTASNDKLAAIDSDAENSPTTEAKEELPSQTGSNSVGAVTNLEHDILIPLPAGKVSIQRIESESNVKAFNRFLKQSCQLSHNKRLLETATFVDTLNLNRSFYSFTKSDLLCRVVSVMKHLHTLKLGGGQMGPIAFRFIVTSLRYNTTIKHLDLSDNLANPECSAAIGRLVMVNTTLQVLNLSGNRLGKDSLSRHVGSAMHQNSSLKSLDISNCGATDLHCLCESIRNSNCSSLMTLKVADNTISDDHQFMVDISLILESNNCKLENVDVSNTSLSPNGMNILIEAISKNLSIHSLQLGKNAISNTKKLCMMLINICTHPNMRLFSMGKTKVDDPNPRDFTECTISNEGHLSVSKLQHLDISDCSVDSTLLQYLASQLRHKLINLVFLDVSKNDIGQIGFDAVDKMTDGQLKELNVMQIQNSDGIVEAITSKYNKVSRLDFTRTKLCQDDIKKLSDHAMHNVTSLSLNGLKLGGLAIFSGKLDAQASLHLTELHLSVCQLMDDDMNPLCNRVGQQALPLKILDVSVNRLTSSFIQNFVESTLKYSHHCIQNINASNNAMDGLSLKSLLKLFTTAPHSPSLSLVNLAHNDITASDVTDFLSNIRDREFPLQSLDLSHQNDSFIESDMEELAKLIKETLDSKHNMWGDGDFMIDLRGNGGSETSYLSEVDSTAIKTDFVMKRKPELTLRDVIEIMKGIQFQNGGTDLPLRCSISADMWKEVVLKDAPAWVLVNSDLSKAAYISHMPSTATSQRIQGMLEMDADSDIKDLFLVKDPITQQSTGAAWVLFQDMQSMSQSVDWFYNGNAHIFGNQFGISEIPLSITDESDTAIDAANRDLKLRDIEAKQRLAMDQKVLEESLKLAAERAEYREVHPAYQGGRIS